MRFNKQWVMGANRDERLIGQYFTASIGGATYAVAGDSMQYNMVKANDSYGGRYGRMGRYSGWVDGPDVGIVDFELSAKWNVLNILHPVSISDIAKCESGEDAYIVEWHLKGVPCFIRVDSNRLDQALIRGMNPSVTASQLVSTIMINYGDMDSISLLSGERL